MIGIAPFDFHALHAWLRVAVALVWLAFGAVFKALGAVPRHRQIVTRVVGEARAESALWLVVVAEVGLAVWMLVGRALVVCAAAQTALIVAMNALELRNARDLLLSPTGMVCANALFLSAAWYVAFTGP
jgi:hypothetical protein